MVDKKQLFRGNCSLHCQGRSLGNMRSEEGGPFENFLLLYETTRSNIPKYCYLQTEITPPEIKYILLFPWCSIATYRYIILSYLLASLSFMQNLHLTCRLYFGEEKPCLLYTQVLCCVFQKLSLGS